MSFEHPRDFGAPTCFIFKKPRFVRNENKLAYGFNETNIKGQEVGRKMFQFKGVDAERDALKSSCSSLMIVVAWRLIEEGIYAT